MMIEVTFEMLRLISDHWWFANSTSEVWISMLALDYTGVIESHNEAIYFEDDYIDSVTSYFVILN